jgi:LemA protein
MGRGAKAALLIGGVAVLGLLIFVSWYFSLRNGLVQKRETIQANWSQVDVVIQRRADLIPNLVETVKGYAAHEDSIFKELADARAAMAGAKTPADRIAADQQVGSALSRLMVVVENYPNLKANENFLRLQDELAGTENRIAVERRNYNQAVQDYNTAIQLFPGSMVASIGGFTREDAYFKAEEAARPVPKVDFAK